MSTNVSGVTSHFPDAENGFTTTTSGAVASGATTVGLNSVAGYNNGQPAVFVIDPTDAIKKQTFTGIVDTSGSQLTNVVWTAGTNQPHALGATVVDYATATHIAMMSKGVLVHANQDGSLKKQPILDALGISGTTPPDYTLLPNTPNTVTYNGNRSYNLVFNSVDLTPTLNPGTRLRTTRTAAAPTQSTSLNGTNQYWNNTSPNKMTFTDDFVVSAWIKLSSYSNASIVSRFNGTSGWDFRLTASGQVQLSGFNASSANESLVLSYQSLPLNKWVHVSAQLDMSSFTVTPATSYIMLDGVDIPASVSRSGTNPTSLIQAGNIEVGSRNGGLLPFPGKIAQATVFNAKVTQSTMQGYISQGLTGSEPNLSSAWSFNGVATDLNTTTPNNLTAQGSATATNADSPFGGQANGTISSTIDYGIVQSVAFSTNSTVVVQVPEGNTIPTTGGVSAVSYSPAYAPYGFPSKKMDQAFISGDFSRSEVNTGNIWVDGKSIYKATFISSITGSGSEQAINLNIPPFPIVTSIIKAEGVVYDSGNWYPFEYVNPAATTSQNAQMKIRLNSNNWQVAFNTGVTGTLAVTVYYVK